MSPRLPAFLGAFEHRNFRLLWAGAFLSSVGTWIQDVALSWVIHTEFKNPAYLGWRQFAAEAPLVIFMLVGGASADRFDRKTILLASQWIQMVFAIVLAILYGTGRLSIVAVLIIGALTGLAQSQSAPTYQAFLTSIVPRDVIPRAVAMNSIQFNLSRSIGPAIAAKCLVIAGASWCFALNAVSFVAIVIALFMIRIPVETVAKPKESVTRSIKDGFAFAWGSPEISIMVLLAAALSFFVFPLTAFLPVVADDILKSGASGYSTLLTAMGLGAIVGALGTAHRGRFDGRGKFVLICWISGAALGAAAVLCGRQWLATAMLFFFGILQVSGSSTLNGLVQEAAPEEMRGRIVALYGLAFRGGSPLGALCLGYAVTWVGPGAALSCSLVAMALLCTLVLARSERIKRF